MTGLGDRLREARTARGYSLDDLQAITKIQKRYLLGIENEDYSMMPGSFYVRAFIKQYAEAVGLDTDEMLLLYKDSPNATQTEMGKAQIPSAPLTRRKGLKNADRLNQVLPKIIVALFIIIIIAVAYFLSVKNASNNNNKEVEVGKTDPPITQVDNNAANPGKIEVDKENTKDDVEAEVEPDPEPEIEPVVQALQNTSINGETATYELSNAESFQLEIRTNGDSWIGVKDSANQELITPNADVKKAGEVINLDVSDTNSVRIRVGRTYSTEIYVNGELLTYASDLVTQNIIIEYKKEE